jgi:AraC-like DNA-binding protein
MSGSILKKLESLFQRLISLPQMRFDVIVEPVDLLDERLIRARTRGAVFARTVARPPWGLRLGGSIQLAVHTVVQGRGWLWLADPQGAVELLPGTVALVRGGPDHYIGHEPGVDCLEPDEFRARHRSDMGLDASRTTVSLCGAYQFRGDIGAELLGALPPVLTLSPTIDDPVRDVVTLMSRELAGTEPAQSTVLDRLLDVLLVLAIRSEFRRSPTAPAWYQASTDERLNAALQAMHEDPARPWTVAQLAALSGLSRASFTRIFGAKLGQPPMQYLTEWRMTLARDYLRDGNLSHAHIAKAVGYQSPYAFAAAFRRHHGEPPGAWRQRQTEYQGTAPQQRHVLETRGTGGIE